jgi:hypothetical protein
LGYDPEEALSLGRRLAGMNAQSKGQMLGIYHARDDAHRAGLGEELWIHLCGRSVPARLTDKGIRAVQKDQPVDPEKTRSYLESKLGGDLGRVRAAMESLAETLTPDELAEQAYMLYTRFRPVIPKGQRGWGAKGDLDLDLIRSLKI